jgi:penicillin-binding protein 1C
LWRVYPLPHDMLTLGPSGAIALNTDRSVLLDVTAHDEMRRLPVSLQQVSPWIPKALIAAEDARFNTHVGIDPFAVLSALGDNVASGRVVRGASTITMQVAGMQLGHPRTWSGKAVEGFRALQLDAAFSKDQIIEGWLNMASFGGNVVGIEAASRRWFGKPARNCTLAESALLVGLPKLPERLRPDRFPQAAINRRNAVLERMRIVHAISDAQCAAAIREQPLFAAAKAVPNDAHVGWMAVTRSNNPVRHTTIDQNVQAIAQSVVQRHVLNLPSELDIAVVVVELETSAVRAVIGSSNFNDPRDGQINGAITKRSPGSALKPFVYAAAFEAKRLSPDAVVDDAPLDIDGWRPRNIDRVWLGEMTAAEALQLSRNTPALRVARDMGLPSTAAMLRRCGLDVSAVAESKAGLSMVVGGLAVTPWNLAEAYATLARGGVHRPLRLLATEQAKANRVVSQRTCTAIEHCLAGGAGDTSGILPFLVAKTGTSSGHRDAIAAGWNRRWAAVVWVGRFDDAGDAVLLGADAALPMLQELLHHPSLATTRSGEPYVPWKVRRAVGRATSRPTVIMEPRDGEVFIAINGAVRLTPKVRTAGDSAVLFLDGAPVSIAALDLPLGPHELRLVEADSPAHAIHIFVKTAP